MGGGESHKMKGRMKIEKWKWLAVLLVLYDILAIHAAYFLALWLRFDGMSAAIPGLYMRPYRGFITWYAVGCVPVYAFFKMYKGMWRYASYGELTRILLASILSGGLHVLLINLIWHTRMPLSYHLLGFGMQTAFLLLPRFSFRMIRFVRASLVTQNDETAARVMIVGAGEAGQQILRDLKSAKEINDRPVCIIDDDENKRGRMLMGVPVVGSRENIFENVKKYHVDKIFIAIPSAPASAKKELVNICNETGCDVKILPGMYQLMLGQLTVSTMRDVSVEDLLGRDPIKADMSSVYRFVNGKVVLVTGGGGSIGSELCRQVAAHNPRKLIIFEIYENNAFEIRMELKQKYPDLDLEVLIGSVRDSRRVFEVFSKYHPDIVYHAAAHKHVPLMEDSPCEAIKNNALGTYKTAYAAMVHGCERFVLISTDKAVNPTNIMGASKRLCEMIIQSFDAKIKAGKAGEIPQLFTHFGIENADKDGSGTVFRDVRTEFVAVRFGNVLGSNGSVIPIFKKQIAEGGPVTVTHPDIIRYFMTIPEAVSLVLQASYYAHGGEIFILDMGEPVKIDTLARTLIKLSGHKPDEDIMIEYTGLRPGEKLYEEKLMEEEGMQTTPNKLIHIGLPIEFDVEKFYEELRTAMMVAYNDDEAGTREWVMKIVDTYHPANN